MIIPKIFLYGMASSILFFGACAQRKLDSGTKAANDYRLDRPADKLISALQAGQEQQLLVVVRHDEEALGLSDTEISSSSPSSVARRAEKYRIQKSKVISSATAKKIRIEDSYSHLPIFKVYVKSLKDLTTLAADQTVLRISENVTFKHNNSPNLNLIRHAEAMQKGFNGGGTSIAVLDSGLDYKRSAFGSCTAPSAPSATCRVVHAQDFAPNDNLLDDGQLHGTNVAGIVAAVAPGTKLIGLDVFDGNGASASDILAAINWVIANRTRFNISAMNMSFGGSGFIDCVNGSLPVAIATARAAGILSVAAAGNSGLPRLDLPACAPQSISVGAVYDSDIGTIDWGCVKPEASLPDKFTCFTNVGPGLKMAAPGVRVPAAGITMSGTSQATPHVAGALAVLSSAFPTENPDQLEDRLLGSGKIVTNPSYPLTKVTRLDLAAALGPRCQYIMPPEINTLEASLEIDFATGAACNWTVTSEASWIQVLTPPNGKGRGTFSIAIDKPITTERVGVISISGDGSRTTLRIVQPPDTVPPLGSLVINSLTGNQYTSQRNVSLVVDVSDISDIAAMCISNTPTCTNFIPYQKFSSWTLPDGDGLKTVYAYVRDGIGNTTRSDQPLTQSITLDTTPPTGGRLTAVLSTVETRAVDLDYGDFIDSTSPIQSYLVVFSRTQVPPSCANGNLFYSGPFVSRTHGPLAPGTYHYRVCATNAANLTSSGVTASIVIGQPDTLAPLGSISMNSNAQFTTSTVVSLAIQATDQSGVAKMCISTTPSCQTWEAFATSKTINLASSQGLQTVYAWFEDNLGNRSALPTQDDIILDTVPPAIGLLSSTSTQNSITVAWRRGVDTNGIGSYRLVYKQGARAPRPNCVDGISVPLTPGALSGTAANLTANTAYSFRACSVDKAGNVGTGRILQLRTL